MTSTNNYSTLNLIAVITFMILITGTFVMNLQMLAYFDQSERIPSKGSEYLVHTESCKIFAMESRVHRNWDNIVPQTSSPACTEDKLFELDDDTQVLHRIGNFSAPNASCCFHEVLPPDRPEIGFTITPCFSIESDALFIQQAEMFLVRCTNEKPYLDSNLKDKAETYRKIQYWKKKNIPHPFSVVIIGIHSMSRVTAYNVLPKTLDFIQNKMGFTDFKGFHSLAADGGLSNLIAVLTGHTMNQVTNDLRITENAKHVYWEQYPFIWNDFNSRNYVTMYAKENLIQDSANFMGNRNQSSEILSPPLVDYCVQRVLKAMRKNQRNMDPKVRSESQNCRTAQTIPQFLLRYTRRFLTKFLGTPSFSFTFIDEPLKIDYESLDNELLQFFAFLRTEPQILEDTFFVFVSDGNETIPEGSSWKSVLDRSLPPLFIRLPTRLPNWYRYQLTLIQNADLLTSPFDLHQTMVHLIGLHEKWSLSPVPDRSSLLLPVPRNRTCDTIHVYGTSCICNLTTESALIRDPDLESFVTRKLNEVISNSKESSEVCAEWASPDNGLLINQILKKSEDEMDIFVQFKVTPVDSTEHYVAVFETKVRKYQSTGSKQFELIEKFQRINGYSNPRECMGFSNMYRKSLCYCNRNGSNRKQYLKASMKKIRQQPDLKLDSGKKIRQPDLKLITTGKKIRQPDLKLITTGKKIRQPDLKLNNGKNILPTKKRALPKRKFTKPKINETDH